MLLRIITYRGSLVKATHAQMHKAIAGLTQLLDQPLCFVDASAGEGSPLLGPHLVDGIETLDEPSDPLE